MSLTTRHGRLSPQNAYARWTKACAAAGWHGSPVPEKVHVADGLYRVLAGAGASPVAVAALRLRGDGRHSDRRSGCGQGGDPSHRICLGRYRGSDTRLGRHRGGTGADPDPIRRQRGHDGSGTARPECARAWRGLRRRSAARSGRTAAAPGGSGRGRRGRPNHPACHQATHGRDRPDCPVPGGTTTLRRSSARSAPKPYTCRGAPATRRCSGMPGWSNPARARFLVTGRFPA